MTYQPVVPVGGYAGWVFLNRTMDTQQAAFNSSAAIQRDVDYFKENIGEISSAEALVNDRRLLSVALGAFGLDDDINNKYFIQKVLDDGTLDDDALANKLSDKRYFEFSKAFGFGDFDTPNTVLSEFPDDIVNEYWTINLSWRLATKMRTCVWCSILNAIWVTSRSWIRRRMGVGTR